MFFLLIIKHTHYQETHERNTKYGVNFKFLHYLCSWAHILVASNRKRLWRINHRPLGTSLRCCCWELFKFGEEKGVLVTKSLNWHFKYTIYRHAKFDSNKNEKDIVFYQKCNIQIGCLIVTKLWIFSLKLFALR